MRRRGTRPGMILAGALAVLLLGMASCGEKGGQTLPPASPASSLGAAPDAGPPHPPRERPFASTPVEAQTLIQSEIDAHIKTLWRCVEDYRARKGDPHKAVMVDVGIDQEGTLLGVTANSKQGEFDPALKDCLFRALRGLVFPRSHAGVITVRQTFTDAPLTP